MKENEQQKPPTIRVGVIGFDGFSAKQAINWERLITLPPFQMFAAEKLNDCCSKDAQQHAIAFVQMNGAGQDLYEKYCEWHAAKGHWPNETPMGELKE